MSYINTYLDSQKKLLEESFLLFEAHKHWPESYIKSAANKLMSRFQQTGLTQEQALEITSAAAQKFGAWFSHDSKRCPLFDKMILWMCEMPFQSLQLVNVNSLLDVMKPIVDGLQLLVASDIPEHSISRIKMMSLDEFAKACVKARQTAQNDIPVSAGQHEVIPISSWQQMNSLYGGKTGFNGAGGWCHTEGKGTWDNWTKNGIRAFFVIQREGWQDIKTTDPETVPTAFDDYGMSLIAILVDVETGDLIRETLRWNHKKAPPLGESYVDHAFEDSWEKLDKAVGLDVKSICDEHLVEARQKIQRMKADLDGFIKQCMQNAVVVDATTIPDECRQYVKCIVVPDSVESIGKKALNRCTSLTSIVIPDSVTSIGENAFSYCTSLRSIVIPDSVDRIEKDAFWHCESLKSIVIPDSVESIGSGAFYCCSSLTSIVIPDSITSLRNSAFSWCISLTSIVIPESVKSIEEDAFNNCSSLTSIVIPDSVESIENGAFNWCLSLTSIVIPDSVESIGDSAFYHCLSLTSIVIPDSVTNIGDQAFDHCTSLKSIVFKGKTLEEVRSIDYYPWGADESIIKAEL